MEAEEGAGEESRQGPKCLTKTPFDGMVAMSNNAGCQLYPLALTVAWFPQTPGSVVTILIVGLITFMSSIKPQMHSPSQLPS